MAEDREYRDVVQPERLKHHDLEGAEYAMLGRNAPFAMGTDLDSHAWPTQISVYYDDEKDITIVQPVGQHNTLPPYKLSGIIRPQDAKKHFLAAIVQPIIDGIEGEQAMGTQVSEVMGSITDPVAEAIDADDEDEDGEFDSTHPNDQEDD